MSYGRERYVAADEDRRAELMEGEMTGTMTLEQARALARKLRPESGLSSDWSTKMRTLCDLILSDDLKREIENAAYERAARVADEYAYKMELATDKPHPLTGKHNNVAECKADAGRSLASYIRALIQPAKPTAQKEDGE